MRFKKQHTLLFNSIFHDPGMHTLHKHQNSLNKNPLTDGQGVEAGLVLGLGCSGSPLWPRIQGQYRLGRLLRQGKVVSEDVIHHITVAIYLSAELRSSTDQTVKDFIRQVDSHILRFSKLQQVSDL